MKVIQVNTPKGKFQLPLKLVAENRADYYGQQEDFKKGTAEYIGEVNYVMDDDFEGIDWLLNNMNWSDVKGSATKVNDEVNVTDEDFFTSSDDFEIVETNAID